MQRGHDLRRGRDRVAGLVGGRGVAAVPLDLDLPLVRLPHCRARVNPEPTGVEGRPHVHPEDAVDSLQAAVGDHRRGAAGEALLVRLEDEADRTRQRVARLREDARGAEEHGGVGVVSAEVSDAGDGTPVGEVVVLLDREGVHVGAEGDALGGARSRVRGGEVGDHAGAPDPLRDLEAGFPQLSRHDAGGAHGVEAEFGVGVDVALNFNDAG